ncbi:MAG: hypothetical protein HQ481_19490 [Alphaproteobacteria bacterium]|nr:hypothetical protein [Alphaproteobacteria bacterium]
MKQTRAVDGEFEDLPQGSQAHDDAYGEQPEKRRGQFDPAAIGGLDALITPQGDLRTRPDHLAELGGLDGFYAARLVKGG